MRLPVLVAAMATVMQSFIDTVYTQSTVAERTNATVIPVPIYVPPSTWFEGVDGRWSTINIRVGTPAQNVRVLVSTASQITMVVLPQGCTGVAFPSPLALPANCASSRGGLFNNSASSTWARTGIFSINQPTSGFESNLGYALNATYGVDTVALGYNTGVDSPSLTNQTVAAFGKISPFYLGIFGMGTQPINYTDLWITSAPSFLVNLKSQGAIPSLSWSYTAGAVYRLKSGSYGQLMYGGYDSSRFISNSAVFTIAQDIDRDLVVNIQSITYHGTTQSSLLSSPVTAFIDSTDPNIWLPRTACLEFENAFGLVMDNNTGLYLINDTSYRQLSTSNPSVTFRLSDSASGGEFVDIQLPFNAFALQASYPLVQNSSYYFPLREAVNPGQYTLGRTFLQEAYLTVDHERSSFYVRQCIFNEVISPNTVVILPVTANTTTIIDTPTDAPTDDATSPSKLSNGSIAGIVVGIIGALCAMAVYYFYRRYQTLRHDQTAPVQPRSPLQDAKDPSDFNIDSTYPELPSNQTIVMMPKTELMASESEIFQLPTGVPISQERQAVQWDRAIEIGGVEQPSVTTGRAELP